MPVPFPVGLTRSLIYSRLLPSGAVAFMMAGGDRALTAAMLRVVRSLPPETLKGRLAAASVLLLCAGQGAVLFLFGTFPRFASWWAERRVVSWAAWIGIVVVAMTLGWK